MATQNTPLLNLFGLQKMQQGAEGETGQRFYNRDSFKNTAANLAMGLNSMRLNPDASLPQRMQAQIAQRKQNLTRNRTVEALRKKAEGGDKLAQKYLGAIESGALPVAQAMSAYMQESAQIAAEGRAAARAAANRVTSRLMTAEEVAAAGLPPGGSYQVDSRGVVSTVAKPVAPTKPSTFMEKFSLWQKNNPSGTYEDFIKAEEAAKGDETALMQNFAFVQKLMPDADPQEILRVLKSGNTFNLGDDFKIDGDYVVTKGPDGKPVFEVIPGSKTDLAQKKAAQSQSDADTASTTQAESQAASGFIVLEDIMRAKDAIQQNPLLTTGLGAQLTQGIGGSPAANVAALLAPIKANIGFDRLQRMREESPTGGALGQVAVKELDFLQSVFGSLEQTQDSKQLLENLTRLEDQYKGSMLRIYNAALKDQQDGKINKSTGELVNPLDYFNQDEIDLITGKGDDGGEATGPSVDDINAMSDVDLTKVSVTSLSPEARKAFIERLQGGE